ncbi:MAG: hypothetical protein WCA46_13895 [Actinocatenispora sp.]
MPAPPPGAESGAPTRDRPATEWAAPRFRQRRENDHLGDGERGLRGLVGSGSTQVTVTAAMRARDAARPTDEDLRTAERELTIIRRHWVPRDPPQG